MHRLPIGQLVAVTAGSLEQRGKESRSSSSSSCSRSSEQHTDTHVSSPRPTTLMATSHRPKRQLLASCLMMVGMWGAAVAFAPPLAPSSALRRRLVNSKQAPHSIHGRSWLWRLPPLAAAAGGGGDGEGGVGTAATESRTSTPRHTQEEEEEKKGGNDAWAGAVNTRRPARPRPQPFSMEEARERWRQFINDKINLADNGVTIPLQDVDAMFDLGEVQAGEPGTFLIREGPVEEEEEEEETTGSSSGKKKTKKERWAERRELFYILDGAVRIQVRGQRVARLSKKDFLGEASFVSGKRAGPRSVTASCSGEEGAQYIAWDHNALKTFLSEESRKPLKAALNEYWVQQLSKKLLATMGTYERAWTPEEEPADALDDELRYGADFGFRNTSAFSIRDRERAADPLSKAIPGPAWRLARWNFVREYQAIRRSIRFDGFRSSVTSANPIPAASVLRKLVIGAFASVDQALEKLSLFPVLRQARASTVSCPRVVALQSQLQLLTLSNAAIEEREKVRRSIQQDIVQSAMEQGVAKAARMKQLETPLFVLLPYYALCGFLDAVFDGRPIARFWFLETVARVPYFSYISMLHLYETLGWWTIGTDVRRVHFAEEWNELHHLQIMEALGGDTRWLDRFLARHAAILYYWILNALFLFSPRMAYNFSELIESHAVDTYSQFVDENEALLKRLPAPRVAIEYYVRGDLFLFDEFQTSRPAYSRRPVIRSLYDVFTAIRDDESEHVKTISALQTNDELPISPNAAAANAAWAVSADEEEEEAAEKQLEEDWVSEGRGWDEGDRWWLEEPDYFDEG